MIKYIVFDFDGTLVDSKHAFQSAWNQLAEKHQFNRIETHQIESLMKMTIKERSKALKFPLMKLPLVVPELTRLYRESMKSVYLFDGIRDMLHRLLETGYKLAIISSNSEDNISAFLQEYHLSGTVEEVMCSSRIFGKDKVIKKFLEKHQLESSEILYVGDESRDILACKKLGVKIMWVGWGFDSEEVISTQNPNYRAYSPQDIVNILSKLGR